MNIELSAYMDEIRSTALSDSLSDDALVALSRIWLSVQTLSGADDCRNECEAALGRLYDLCSRRCCSGEPLARRSRMLPALYDMLYVAMRGIDSRKSAACDRYMCRAIDDWRHNPSDESVSAGIMLCICDYFSYADSEDKNVDEDFRLYERRLADWVSEMDSDGIWPELGDSEALRRLEVLSRNSNTHLDPSYDNRIGQSLDSYYSRIASDKSVGCQTLYRLYDVLMRGVGRPDCDKADVLLSIARERMSDYPAGSDERLWLAALCIDRLCMSVNAGIQHGILARTA